MSKRCFYIPVSVMVFMLVAGAGCSRSGSHTEGADSGGQAQHSVDSSAVRHTTAGSVENRAVAPSSRSAPSEGESEAPAQRSFDGEVPDGPTPVGRPAWQAVEALEGRQATPPQVTTFMWQRDLQMQVTAAAALAAWFSFGASTDPCYVMRDNRRSTQTRCDVEVTRTSGPTVAIGDGGVTQNPPGVGVDCLNARGARVLFDSSESAPRIATPVTTISPGGKAIVQVTNLRSCWLHGGTTLHFSVESRAPRAASRPRRNNYGNGYY